MQWRKLFVSTGAAIGGAAAFNAIAQRHVAPLENLIGGSEGWFDWRGRRIAYTVRGRGPSLLLVHGVHTGAWSYEWRANADALARTNTVFTIDLLGFGRSDRPRMRYGPRLYTSLLSDFVRRVVDAPCALAAEGLSAAYAIELAAGNPGRFPALVIVVPSGVRHSGEIRSLTSGAARQLFRAPFFGKAAFNATVTRAGIERVLRQRYHQDRLVTAELVEVYYQASHQPGARHALAAYQAGALNLDARAALRRLTQPSMLVWGVQAVRAPVEESLAFRSLKPDLEVELLQPAGDHPQSERAEQFNAVVANFLG